MSFADRNMIDLIDDRVVDECFGGTSTAISYNHNGKGRRIKKAVTNSCDYDGTVLYLYAGCPRLDAAGFAHQRFALRPRSTW